jgi:hypothetical protein
MPDYLYPIQTLDQLSQPLGGVLINAISPNGNWDGETNDCGSFIPFLTKGSYHVTFSKAGYIPEVRDWNLENRPDAPIYVGLSSAFPAYPTRSQVCNVLVGFQGISILTKQFGWIPAFGPECGWLNEEDCISYCQQMKKLGFTHVEFDISGRYVEPSYQYPVPGIDYTNDLAAACKRVELIIMQGMLVKFALAGDGMSTGSSPYGYNDPQGWTYGYQWLVENLAKIIAPFTNYHNHDLTKFCLFIPGYDAVFYGWTITGEVPDLQPTRVISFGTLFRSILPNGYLGIEHSTGKIPVGEDGRDWKFNGPLDAYDTLLSEYDPFNLHSDPTWQILGRCTRPYNRPPDQPTGDDPSPPYIIEPCTRGVRFYIMYEIVTYLWVRGEITIAQCNQIVDYFQTMAPNATLCMIRQAA